MESEVQISLTDSRKSYLKQFEMDGEDSADNALQDENLQNFIANNKSRSFLNSIGCSKHNYNDQIFLNILKDNPTRHSRLRKPKTRKHNEDCIDDASVDAAIAKPLRKARSVSTAKELTPTPIASIESIAIIINRELLAGFNQTKKCRLANQIQIEEVELKISQVISKLILEGRTGPVSSTDLYFSPINRELTQEIRNLNPTLSALLFEVCLSEHKRKNISESVRQEASDSVDLILALIYHN